MRSVTNVLLVALGMITLTGCQVIFGIDELTFDASTIKVGSEAGVDGGKRREGGFDVTTCDSFTLTAPTSLTLYEEVPATLGIVIGGCASPVAIQLAALPAGISASVTDLVLTSSNSSATITLTAASGVQYNKPQLTLEAVAVGAPTVTAEVSLVPTPVPNGLDTSFADGGVIDSIELSPAAIRALAIDSLDDVIFAGDNGSGGGSGFIVGRYDVNGAQDLGMNPVMDPPIGSGNMAGAAAVALQYDASVPLILAAGTVTPLQIDVQAAEFGIARYATTVGDGMNPGDLDRTFNDGGVVITSIRFDTPVVAGVLDRTNRYLVVGSDSYSNVVVARYTVSGALDTSFGSEGVSLPIMSQPLMQPTSVALTSDGRIILAGGTSPISNAIMITRLTSSGAIDPSFGVPCGADAGSGGGVVLTNAGEIESIATGVALDESDNIYVCGTTTVGQSNRFVLAKYDACGTLDPTFGNAGIVSTNLGTTDDEAAALTVLSAVGVTRVLVAGTTHSDSNGGANYGVGLARYMADGGALDVSFGVNGIVRSVDENTFDQVHALAIDSKGNMLVGGSRLENNALHILLARYRAQ